MLRQALLLMVSAAASTLAAADAEAAPCGAGGNQMRLDWSSAEWSAGARTGTVLADPDAQPGEGLALPLDVDISGATSRIQEDYPLVSSELTGGRGADYDSFMVAVDFSSNSKIVTVRLDFRQPVTALAFDIFDVDFAAFQKPGGRGSQLRRGYRDSLEVTGYDMDGAAVDPELTSPYIPSGRGTSDRATVFLGPPLSARQSMGFSATADPGGNAGNVRARFTRPVRQVTVELSNSFDPPAPNPQPQAIALSDLAFCGPPGADLETSKTQRLISESGAGCRDLSREQSAADAAAVPGACVEYAISVTNTGSGTARDIHLTDTLDSDLVFEAASLSGFASDGPGFGLNAPPPGKMCSGTGCNISLADAALGPGATGEILIRVTVR